MVCASRVLVILGAGMEGGVRRRGRMLRLEVGKESEGGVRGLYRPGPGGLGVHDAMRQRTPRIHRLHHQAGAGRMTTIGLIGQVLKFRSGSGVPDHLSHASVFGRSRPALPRLSCLDCSLPLAPAACPTPSCRATHLCCIQSGIFGWCGFPSCASRPHSHVPGRTDRRPGRDALLALTIAFDVSLSDT